MKTRKNLKEWQVKHLLQEQARLAGYDISILEEEGWVDKYTIPEDKMDMFMKYFIDFLQKRRFRLHDIYALWGWFSASFALRLEDATPE